MNLTADQLAILDRLTLDADFRAAVTAASTAAPAAPVAEPVATEESSFWTQKCNVGVVFNGTAYQAGLSPLEIAAGAALFAAGLMIGAKQ